MRRKEKLRLMGQIVTVEVELDRLISIDPNKKETRTWEEVTRDKPRAGWVVGFTHLRNGIYHPHRYVQSGWYPEPDEESAYLEVTSTIPVIKVVYWFNHSPVYVPLDGYRVGGQPVASPTASEEQRKWYKRDFDNGVIWRDSQGRFLKMNLPKLNLINALNTLPDVKVKSIKWTMGDKSGVIDGGDIEVDSL